MLSELWRKRPIVVSAAVWRTNGDHPDDRSAEIESPDGSRFLSEGAVVRRFRRPDVPGDRECDHCRRTFQDHGWIDTLEGGHIVCPGDFVITGVKGERYPCKPDIFAATYERAETVAQDDCVGASDVRDLLRAVGEDDEAIAAWNHTTIGEPEFARAMRAMRGARELRDAWIAKVRSAVSP